MSDRYGRCVRQWDVIFGAEPAKVPGDPSSGNETLDIALDWLCADTESALDFGCGNGTMLFLCALRKTKYHIGIDLSQKAIENAEKRAKSMTAGTFSFARGGVEQLEQIQTDSVDAVILSNIVDNLYPDDALLLLSECKRILKPNGKALIKLNPYLTQQQIKDWDIHIIEGNLLNDGLLLWNNTTEEWQSIIGRYFHIAQYEEIYYPEHEQTNRLFLVENRQA